MFYVEKLVRAHLPNDWMPWFGQNSASNSAAPCCTASAASMRSSASQLMRDGERRGSKDELRKLYRCLQPVLQCTFAAEIVVGNVLHQILRD
eukprot:6210551-Pleurochrysis_carterae.AAC.3